MTIQRILLAVVVGMSAVAVRAEHRLEVVPANQFRPATVDASVLSESQPAKPVAMSFKLSLTNATREEIIAAATKLLGVSIQAADPRQSNSRPSDGPPIVFDLAIDATTLEDGLDQLGKSLQIGVTRNGETYQLTPMVPIGYRNAQSGRSADGRGVEDRGPPSSRIEAVRASRLLPARPGVPDSTTVAVSIWPGDAGMLGSPDFIVHEAIDEQGRDLISPPRQGPVFGGDRSLRNDRRPHSATLKSLQPASQTLSIFRATARLSVPKSYDRLTITAFDDKPIACTLGRSKVELGPLEETHRGWRLRVRVNHEQYDDNQSKLPTVRLDHDELQAIDARNASGERLRVHSDGGTRVGEWWEMGLVFASPIDRVTRRFSTTAPVPTTRPAGFPKPVSLIWHVVRELESVDVPVVGTNMVIP